MSGLLVCLKSWMLRGKAKVSHTHNEKLVFSVKLVFTQAYVKVIKSGCMHSWSLVCGFFCCKSGCRHSNCKRHVQIHIDIFGGFICIPWCSCGFSCNRRSCKEAAACCCSFHMKKLLSNCCRFISGRTWCAGFLVAGDLYFSHLPMKVCKSKPMGCMQLLLSEHSSSSISQERFSFGFSYPHPPVSEKTFMSLCPHTYCLVLSWQLDRLAFSNMSFLTNFDGDLAVRGKMIHCFFQFA